MSTRQCGMLRRFCIAGALMALMLADLTPARASLLPALELQYDVYYSVVRLVTIASRSRLDPDVYALESRMETVGVVGALFPWSYHSEVHGRIQAAELKPDAFSSRSEFRDRVQEVALRYEDSGKVSGDVQAFDESVLGDEYTRDEVPPELRVGTIDPLTEIASLTQQLARGGGCAGTRRVFDGVRRYDVVYEDLGQTDLEASSYDVYKGPARLCRSRVKPIAGFWKPKEEERSDSLTGVTAWLMPPVTGAAPVPVRLQVEGSRGSLAIHLIKVSTAAS